MGYADFNEGIEIVTERDGTRHAQREPGKEICDFCCGDPEQFPIRWTYPTGLIVIAGHPVIDASCDDWAACDACHELIEKDALAALAARSLDVQIARFGPEHILGKATMSAAERAGALEHVQRHFTTWSAARTGDAYADEPAAPHGKGQQ